MADFLYSIDVSIFYFINHSIANQLFDKFFVYITEVQNWYLVYVILLGIAFFKGGKIGKISVIGALILITLSDQVSSFTLKNWIARVRPCIALPDARILTGCTDSYSFPSSHAVNNFAMFAFFSKLFPDIKWILLITASLVAISRVYVGKHYPSDVLGGAIIGLVFGYFFALLALEVNKRLDKENKKLV